MNKLNVSKIKPAGWIAAAVVVLVVVGGVGLAGRAIWPRVWGLRSLEPVALTPRLPKPTAMAALSPTPPPVPELPSQDWGRSRDIAGEFLVPPPDDEAAVREAFAAVLACQFLEDRPDEEVLAFDREALLERLPGYAAPHLVDFCRQVLSVGLGTLGPENPVRCSDRDTCTLGRAKTGPSAGALIYLEEVCGARGLGTPCVARDVFDEHPYLMFLATAERQGDGTWMVTDWEIEHLPAPPEP
jgi:hypothetical protein